MLFRSQWEGQAEDADDWSEGRPAQWLTDWNLNFYPAAGDAAESEFGGFKREHFSPEEMEELQAACASLSGKAQWVPGSGPGGPASLGLRGVSFKTHNEARAAAESFGDALSPELADRIRVSLVPKKNVSGAAKSPGYKARFGSR